MAAPEIVIDWAALNSEKAFYDAVLPQLNAPVWHGQNLDALWDSIGVGHINGIEPPYCIVMRGITEVPDALADFVRRVVVVLLDAAMAREGIEVRFGDTQCGGAQHDAAPDRTMT